MGHVYFVVPDLNYAGHARQVSLLAPAMNRADWAVGIYSLGGDGPFGPPLRTAGFAVEQQMGPAVRDRRSWFVLRSMFPLPGHGVVHAFGLRVLRRLKLATLGARLPRIVLSLTARERLTWLDRRCLRIVSRVVVPHSTAADALTRQRVPGAKITVVPLAVADAPPTPDRDDFCRAYNLPANAKLIMTAGWMSNRETLFGAVWAFEFLRFLDDNVRLAVIGDGPGRERIEANARALAPQGSHIHFVGARPDVPALLGLADVVVVPQPVGGANVALEAMSAGRPVVAARTADLSVVLRDGETGLLVSGGNPPEMAGAIRRVLLDPELRLRLGSAARRAVRDQHSIDRIIPTLETVYRD
jgi:glycosyltransferase involved in cell wall biosynthesis